SSGALPVSSTRWPGPSYCCFTATAARSACTLSLHDALPISPSPIPSWRAQPNRRLTLLAFANSGSLTAQRILVGYFERAASCLRSEEHTSELQSRENLVCRLLLEKKKVSDSEDRSTSNVLPK